MSRWIITGLLFFSLAACSPGQAEPTITSSPEVPTVTPTPAPTETPRPSPTPTPRPYYLEDGILYDQDELTGDYLVVAEGIDALTTAAEGVIVALDGDGFPRFVFVNGDWFEIKIPEGAENHEELNVQDRYVTIVNEEGKTEEVLESGIKVLVNPETRSYDWRLNKVTGEWEVYVPQVRLGRGVSVRAGVGVTVGTSGEEVMVGSA